MPWLRHSNSVTGINNSVKNEQPFGLLFVYATALEYEADLLTCDAHFGALPGVTLISKAGA
jgi:hypothetical protein